MSESTDPVESGRHPVNVTHLVMGIAFLGLALVWSLVVSDAVDGEDVRWLLPVPWVLGGGAGLLAVAAASRRRHPVRSTGWVQPEDEER